MVQHRRCDALGGYINYATKAQGAWRKAQGAEGQGTWNKEQGARNKEHGGASVPLVHFALILVP
jgi:hypothetical protein